MNIQKIYFDAYKGSEPYIFISYAHKDWEIVCPIISKLHEEGFHIWYDEGIDPGNEWPVEIARALINCNTFIVFISNNSVNSRNVCNEINLALEENKFVLAVHLEETKIPDGLRLMFGSTQAIMKYRMDTDSFYRKIQNVLDGKQLRNKNESVVEAKEDESYNLNLVTNEIKAKEKVTGIEDYIKGINKTVEYKEEDSKPEAYKTNKKTNQYKTEGYQTEGYQTEEYYAKGNITENITENITADNTKKEDIWKEEVLFYGIHTLIISYEDGVEDITLSWYYAGLKRIDIEIGKVISFGSYYGNYKVVRKIGSGGIATVYLVEDLDGDYYIAKIAHDYDLCKAALDREAKILQAIRIDNVPKLYRHAKEFAVTTIKNIHTEEASMINSSVIIEEYIEGKTLEDIINNTDYSLNTKLEYCIRLAKAFKDLHSCSILHNNISSTNIIVQPDNEIKIIDYNSASKINQYDLDVFSGALYYIPPELIKGTYGMGSEIGSVRQFLNSNTGAQSDIYSFGVLLYRLFSNKYPFSGTVKEYRRSVLHSFPEKISTVSENLWDIISRCLSRNLTQRFKNFDEVISDLKNVR